MITTDAQAAFAALGARLEKQARILAEARADDARIAPGDPRRWRRAALLWPLFAKG